MNLNKFLKVALILLPMFMISVCIFAQEVLVHGTVTDMDGEPLIGANIMIIGTMKGTVTDAHGAYEISASPESVIQFSYVGYLDETIEVGNKTEINISMVMDMSTLEQVVVIGYGTAKKSDLTGSVISANIKDFEKSPNANLIQSLQGTVPGLNIGQVVNAGATPNISIRGTNTVSGNKNVLIVLDGIIYNNSLSSINPADIKSVDILKDASSTAVYGAQAANGVILITTKKGKSGQTNVFFSSSYSMQKPTRNYRTMNRAEYLDFVKNVMWNEAYTEESGYTEPNPDFNLSRWMPDTYMVDGEGNIVSTDFNWWDACTREGSILENKLSISGGSDAISYLVSYGRVAQKNHLVNDDFTRNSIRVNLDANPRKWWKLGVQTFGSFVNQDGAEPTLWTLYSMNPLTTPYNEDGTLNPSPMETARPNPLLGSDVDDRERHYYFFGNFYSEFNLPLKGLTYRINFGNNYTINDHFYASQYTEAKSAYKNDSTYHDYTLDNIVNYTKEFGLHNISATFVYGAIERKNSYTNASATDFSRITLGYNSLEQGTNQISESDAWEEALLYQMVRLNYKFKNRYLLTATVRRDGFSGFAENHKSALFPSVALGWVISEESFFKNTWFEYLKIRAGYGISGNQTSRYASQAKVTSQMGYVFGNDGVGVIRQELASMQNNDLKWEKTEGINLGLDFNQFNGRVQGVFEVYKTTTKDLLWNVAIPTITGFKIISSNIGKIENKGIELNITTRNIDTKNFKWTTTFNISSNTNKIVSLTGEDNDGDGKEDDLIASNLFIGEPLSAVYGYKVDGIYQLDDEIPMNYYAGNYKIVNTDTSDASIINTDDRVILGKKDPAYRFGILNNFTYKGFSLSIFINSVQGGKNGYLGENSEAIIQDDNARRNNGISELAELFWSPTNTDGIYSRSVNTGQITPTVYRDRSFIRLQDVTLSYSLPTSLLSTFGIKNLEFYVAGKNLFIITKWKGWDPEADWGQNADGTYKSGVDYDGRPVMKSITAGINITF